MLRRTASSASSTCATEGNTKCDCLMRTRNETSVFSSYITGPNHIAGLFQIQWQLGNPVVDCAWDKHGVKLGGAQSFWERRRIPQTVLWTKSRIFMGWTKPANLKLPSLDVYHCREYLFHWMYIDWKWCQSLFLVLPTHTPSFPLTSSFSKALNNNNIYSVRLILTHGNPFSSFFKSTQKWFACLFFWGAFWDCAFTQLDILQSYDTWRFIHLMQSYSTIL